MDTVKSEFFVKQPKRLIVVEPVVALYSLFGFPLFIMSQLYILEAIESELAPNISQYINTTIDLCRMNTSDPVVVLNAKVQAYASYMTLILKIGSCTPALVSSLFLGAYSDKAGRRYAILPPLIASMLNTGVYVIVIMLDLPIWYLLIGALCNGLGGFNNTMLLGCCAYISDTTSTDKRRFRITVLELCLILPGILGPLGIGKLLETIGYLYCFLITLTGQAIIVLYVIFFVPETVQRDPAAKFFDLSHVKRYTEMFVIKDATGRNVKLTVLLAAFFLGIIPTFDISLDTLYIKNRPVCMSNQMVGYYMSTFLVVATFGGIFAAWFLKICVSDELIALIAGVASTLNNIYKAFVRNVSMMFLSPLFSVFGVLYIPTIRSLMSITVDNTEQGVVFGSIAFAEILCSIIGVAIFNPIYASTQHFMTGFVFLVMAMFYFTGCCIMMLYIVRYWHDKRHSASTVEVDCEKKPLLESAD